MRAFYTTLVILAGVLPILFDPQSGRAVASTSVAARAGSDRAMSAQPARPVPVLLPVLQDLTHTTIPVYVPTWLPRPLSTGHFGALNLSPDPRDTKSYDIGLSNSWNQGSWDSCDACIDFWVTGGAGRDSLSGNASVRRVTLGSGRTGYMVTTGGSMGVEFEWYVGNDTYTMRLGRYSDAIYARVVNSMALLDVHAFWGDPCSYQASLWSMNQALANDIQGYQDHLADSFDDTSFYQQLVLRLEDGKSGIAVSVERVSALYNAQKGSNVYWHPVVSLNWASYHLEEAARIMSPGRTSQDIPVQATNQVNKAEQSVASTWVYLKQIPCRPSRQA